MALGIRNTINQVIQIRDRFRFFMKVKFSGFESATLLFMTLSKHSVIPILKANGASIGSNNDIETPMLFHNCQSFSNLSIGDNCHIGKNCFFDLRGKITIKNNVVISMQTTFITHQDMSKSDLSSSFPATQDDISIHDNCYVGACVTIMQGVTINKNSIIGVKSLVNKNISEYTINYGVPAKKIRIIN